MVGQWTTTKPSRSDDVLDEDQQLKITKQIRAQFDSMAPKRPSKPNRSDPDLSSPTPVETIIVDQTIPELHKLQTLQSDSQVILSGEGATTVEDEFVETQYYRELGSIDKQHHTTGSGFIKVEKEEESEENTYGVQLGAVTTVPAVLRSNPATNDWVPNMDEDQVWFIKVEKEEESEENTYGVQLGAVTTVPAVLRSNPATNDWVPNMDEDQIFISSKPNRSESS